MSFTQRDLIAVQEAADLSAPLNTSVLPRWQRKALAAKVNAMENQGKTPNKGSSKTPNGKKTPGADRFIPNRGAMNFENSHFTLTSDMHNMSNNSCNDSQYDNDNDLNSSNNGLSISMREDEGGTFRRSLAANLLPGNNNTNNSIDSNTTGSNGGDNNDSSHRVLAFRSKAPAPAEGHVNSLKVLYSQNKTANTTKIKSTRHIPSAPERILDAPDMVDDFYLNLLDWSCTNLLAVALGPSVYIWNAGSGAIHELMHTTAPDDFITSVSWIKEGGGYLAIGTNSADVQLWDVDKTKQVRSMRGHTARVGALDWNSHTLSSGSRDTSIFNHDVRIKDHHVSSFIGHTQEVCGLKWSPDGTMLASGGNDNLLCLWDNASMNANGSTGPSNQIAPKFTLSDHQAAVKAVSWCPWQKGLLATGGGTADRTIKLWNAATGSLLNSIDTGSQVTSLAWNPHERELLSSHGFAQNQLTLWKYPSMVKVKELTGHTSRVLALTTSADGSMVCSAGADETLRFWRVFGEARSKNGGPSNNNSSSNVNGNSSPSGLIRGMNIR